MNVNAAFVEPVADDWSCEYQFEELEVEIHGVLVGNFSGTAELANDPGYTFYVKSIVLDGRKRSAGRLWPRYEDCKQSLDRPDANPATLSEHLFKAIADALDCQAAIDHFIAESEGA